MQDEAGKRYNTSIVELIKKLKQFTELRFGLQFTEDDRQHTPAEQAW